MRTRSEQSTTLFDVAVVGLRRPAVEVRGVSIGGFEKGDGTNGIVQLQATVFFDTVEATQFLMRPLPVGPSKCKQRVLAEGGLDHECCALRRFSRHGFCITSVPLTCFAAAARSTGP